MESPSQSRANAGGDPGGTPATLSVALPLPLPQTFDYAWPTGPHAAPRPGCRVRVEFGRGQAVGVVVAVGAGDSQRALKPVDAVIDDEPLFDAELWRTLQWAAAYYHHPLGEVLAAALPALLRAGAPVPALDLPGLALTPPGADALAGDRLRPGPGRTLLARLRDGPLSLARVREELGTPARAAAQRLLRKGWLQACRVAFSEGRGPVVEAPPSSSAQAQVLAALADAEGARAHLLEGVTGSGKTEIYLGLAAQALAQGRQVLILVPEIGLTPLALRRFRERLPGPVQALHSGLSDRERAQTWALARSGAPCVVLGTRSAVFTPLPRAGLIVVDEEHDGSYKQADGFRYHARDLALVRGKALGVPVLLGSATPSLETLALAADGRIGHLHLPARAGGARPPAIELVDLRAAHASDGLSNRALAAIGQTLERGEQVLVFRNRRGWSPVLACAACTWKADCPGCDRPMTLHRGQGLLACHHCGRRQRLPARCPSCGSTALDPRGVGTERLAAALAERWPGHRVLRIDRDSTAGVGRLDRLLDEVERGGPAILVGTQLLAKGHDWPMLTQVVVVDGDGGLYSADFRAPERMAQLLTQVAGRAGRGERPGRVLVQTRLPGHPFWRDWLGGGYATVAQAQLRERRDCRLPPFRFQALLAAEATAPAALADFFDAVRALPDPAGTEVERIGPLPAPMPRRAGHHRMQLILEADRRAPLHALLDAWMGRIGSLRPARRVRWSLDVDPQDAG
ncbi:MAG: primosomal protein N' [Xanthomonadales bacterium]|nr:primosomal protein N' [Xanthomonadales bacterium]